MRQPHRRLSGFVAVWMVLGGAACAPPCAWAAGPIVVGPEGGSAGLNAALDSARTLRASGGKGLSEPVRIVLKPGHYTMSEPLLISSADSGTEKAPLVIEAERPGTVTLAGGPLLRPKDEGKGQWTFAAPEGQAGPPERAGGQLYVNGSRAVLAREPEVGNWWFVRAASADTLQMAAANAARGKALLKGQEDRAIVQLMQSWTSGMHRAEDIKGDGIVLQPAPKWPMLSFGTAQRYFIENVPGALNSAGEWLPQGGRARYIPRPADVSRFKAGQDVLAVWPRMATLVQIQGNDADGGVKHVVLKGLRFAYTTVATPARGWTDRQAAQDVPATIEVNHASDITFTQCEVSDVGGHGIWLRRGARDIEVSRTVFNDLGAGAIKIGDNDSRGSTGHNTIRGNAIQHTGRVFPGAVAIWVGKSGDNVVAGNVIAHTSYTGISLGWTWSFEPQGADNNTVRDNVLFDIGQGRMSDLGGIYTLGQGKGTRITGNLIRQVQDYPHYGAGAWGIYNDEGSSDMTVEGNVVLGTRSGGYHLHYGRDNNVSRNIFAGGGGPEVSWSNPGRSGKWQLKQTTTSRKAGVADVNINSPQADALRGNMGLSNDPNEIAHAEVTGGADVTDVRMSAGAQKDVLDKVVQSAKKTIQGMAGMPIDVAKLTVPAIAPQARPPVQSQTWTFEDARPGVPPAGFGFEPVLAEPIVKVIASPDGGKGGKCLLLEDGEPTLKKYEPYAFVRPNIPLGGASARFTIRLDADSRIVHEWRDKNGAGYKSLLKLTMSAARGLELGDKSLMPLPQGQWLDVAVEVAPGPQPRTWRLTVAAGQDGRRQWQSLPLTGQAASVGWAGWISDGARPARTCIGQVSVTPADAG